MRFVRKIRKANGQGFTLIEVLVSMGLVSVLALVIFALNNFMNKGTNTTDAAFQADQFRKDILQLLNNPAAWRWTIKKNTTFSCVYAGGGGHCENYANQGPPTGDYSYSSINIGDGPCSAGVCYGGFDVYDAGGTVYYSPASTPGAGFTKAGARCSAFAGTYNATTKKWTTPIGTAATCPFRLVLWWQPICPTNAATQCANPPIHVKGYTLFAPYATDANQGSFNPGNYGIDVILPPNYQ